MADAQGVGGALVEGDLRNYSGDPVLLSRNRQIFIQFYKEKS